MNKENKKIEILKYLAEVSRRRADIHQKSGLDWGILSGLLFDLKADGLIINIYGGYSQWQITPEGIDAIKKWDLDGTPGELFEEVK